MPHRLSYENSSPRKKMDEVHISDSSYYFSLLPKMANTFRMVSFIPVWYIYIYIYQSNVLLFNYINFSFLCLLIANSDTLNLIRNKLMDYLILGTTKAVDSRGLQWIQVFPCLGMQLDI